jgi:hypothetical protein
MGECIYEYPVEFMSDFFQTRNVLPRTYRKGTDASEDFFGLQSNNCFIHAELDYFDQILKEHYTEPTYTRNETKDYQALDNNFLDISVNKKPQLNLNMVSNQLLQKLQEKSVNLVLVATSLDENYVVQKIKGSLDPQTSSMIPLSFDEKYDYTNQLNSTSGLASLKRESKTNYSMTEDKSKKFSSSKLQKDEKYWKRRTSNNEAARRSREAKRSRFTWIQNRIKELEVENANLQKELNSLEQKVLQL